jgi:hypothetical protein
MTIRELHATLTGFIEQDRGHDEVLVGAYSDRAGKFSHSLETIASSPGAITFWVGGHDE